MSGAISPYKDKLASFRKTLARMGPQLEMAAPDHIKARRMQRMCMTVVQQNPNLLDCTKESLLGAIMTAAQLGLYPDVSVLGHAYFVPFKKKVTFIAGYKGLIDLAGRGGMGVISIKTSERNGEQVGAVQVAEEDEVMLITNGGTLVRTRVARLESGSIGMTFDWWIGDSRSRMPPLMLRCGFGRV